MVERMVVNGNISWELELGLGLGGGWTHGGVYSRTGPKWYRE